MEMDKHQLIQRALFGVSPDGSPSIVGTWFGYTNFTLTTVLFGISFLLACIATAAYYVLVVVTEPSQQVKRRSKADTINWDFQRILRLFHLAYTTYTTLELENLTCQKKILCEFQESSGIIGSTTRRISSFLLYFNFFKSFPKIKEYKEAIDIGQRSSWKRSSITTTDSKKRSSITTTDSRNSKPKHSQRTSISSNTNNIANETTLIVPENSDPDDPSPIVSPTCEDYFQDCGFSVHEFNGYYNKVFYNVD